jgi:hypothetical protein
MPGIGITDNDLEGIYEVIVNSGIEGISREEFIELIRPLKRSVQSLLKMMECNGFLLFEDCVGEIDFRIYAFTDEVIDLYDDLERMKGAKNGNGNGQKSAERLVLGVGLKIRVEKKQGA